MSIEDIDTEIARLQHLRTEIISDQQSRGRSIQYGTFKCAKSGNKNIVIIGGAGQIGQLFTDLFKSSGYQVSIIEKNDWHNIDELIQSAALIMVAVPINMTVDIINLLKNIPTQCVLTDVTSIKVRPLKAMLDVHQGPVVGLHPMFGPDVKSFQDQTVIVCDGKGEQQYRWLIEQLEIWQAVPYLISAEKHDAAMSMVQVMRHFSTTTYGYHLMQEDVELAEIIQLSSPIYRLELAMVGRLFAQDPNLYADIIFSNLDNVKGLRRYAQRFEQLLSLMEANDKDGFIDLFNQTAEWFGDYASQFLAESSEMLENTQHVTTK